MSNARNIAALSTVEVGATADQTKADLNAIGVSGGRKNLIINGGFDVSQRGSSFTVNGYGIDRWKSDAAHASNYTIAHVTDAPNGFTNSLKITTSTVVSAPSYEFLQQPVEGSSVAHLKYGTSEAEIVSVSFMVKSSLTGVLVATLVNSSNNYSYPAPVTINSANTWERKTVTIVGPTGGTWLTGNNVGLRLKIDLGAGSSFEGTANSWQAADRGSLAGAIKLGATLNATLQITGVQLELGSVATDFEHRSYGEELALCQRYFETAASSHWATLNGAANVQYSFNPIYNFAVTKRVTPTLSLTVTAGFTYQRIGLSVNGFDLRNTSTNQSGGSDKYVSWTADSEL